MRKVLVALFAFLVASSAFAGTISSLSPSSFKVNSGEHFITVFGVAPGNLMIIDGPSGHFERSVNATFSDRVVGWVPEAVIAKSGTYTVKVRNAQGIETNSLTFTVNGFKFFPLAILLPDFLVAQPKSRDGGYVHFDVFVAGGEDPAPKWSCDQRSGDFFKMGVTRVNCEASNAFGERASASFDILVADRVGPVVTVSKDISVPARSNEGTVVDYEPGRAIDEIWGEMPVECLPRSGSNFRIGRHTVVCTSVDIDLNMGSRSFLVEVTSDRQLEKLVLIVPENLEEAAKDPRGAEVFYEVDVKNTKDPNPTLTCLPKSGEVFPLGVTEVACDAYDADGAWGIATFNVLVKDVHSPDIRFIKASPNQILNDGRMYPVTISHEVVDDLDLQPTCGIIGVNANENIYPGDLDKEPEYDFEIVKPMELLLRGQSVRSRVYNVWVGCFDFFGNIGQSYAQVVVSNTLGGQGTPQGRRRASGKP
ncbi:MAG TPA: hypothetical protein VEK79_17560 [Thermoanaerobaculia bacterium]|nr:hypothetical protein [Thermoanaerobaculia bacterium]